MNDGFKLCINAASVLVCSTDDRLAEELENLPDSGIYGFHFQRDTCAEFEEVESYEISFPGGNQYAWYRSNGCFYRFKADRESTSQRIKIPANPRAS